MYNKIRVPQPDKIEGSNAPVHLEYRPDTLKINEVVALEAPMEILVINDDLMERSVIQQVLEHSQHKVRFVPTVREGWKLLNEEGFRFVIVDGSQEEQTAEQFIQHVRTDPNLPGHTYIIVVINKGQDGKLVSGLGQGADDYLNKPVAPQELKSRVSVGVRILSMGDTLKEAREQLEAIAMYDPLTGLMNRNAFHKVAQGELERARRGSEGLSAIALNIDNFKAIHSGHSQAVGDNVLQIVAQIVREKCRPYDCIGRWAADQFTIVLPGVLGSDAEKITLRILSGVQASEISLANGLSLEVKVSAGIATSQNIHVNAEIDGFIQSALMAMNNARQNREQSFSLIFI